MTLLYHHVTIFCSLFRALISCMPHLSLLSSYWFLETECYLEFSLSLPACVPHLSDRFSHRLLGSYAWCLTLLCNLIASNNYRKMSHLTWLGKSFLIRLIKVGWTTLNLGNNIHCPEILWWVQGWLQNSRGIVVQLLVSSSPNWST